MKFSQVLLVFAFLFGFSHTAAAQYSGVGGCPGSQREGLPPCCATFTVPSGGSDSDRTCVGPATQYRFTIYEFGFENDAGEVTSLGSETSFDAASVGAGEEVGQFISGAVLPPGHYPYIRPVISQDYTVTADITTLNGRHCVGTTTGHNNEESTDACNAQGINPNYAPRSEHENCVSGGRMHIRDGQAPITVTDGGSLSYNFAFYVESGVTCTFAEGGSGDTVPQVGWLNAQITQN